MNTGNSIWQLLTRIGLTSSKEGVLDPRWTQAACRDADTELFFPRKILEGREAIRICDACPIEQFCHDFAERNDEVGIWGGYPFGLVVEGRKGDRLVAKLRPKGRPKQYQPGIDREMQVADLLAEGYGPHEISKKLDITLRTVQRHVRQLRERGEAA